MPVLAVLVLCAACMVTVAYAYNANYKDTVPGVDVDPQEKSKFIYITGEGLSYPGEDVDATIEVKYSTTTTTVTIVGEGKTQVIETHPDSYLITELYDSEKHNCMDEDGIATIKIGTVDVISKNTDSKSVTVIASDLIQKSLGEHSFCVFKNALTTDNIKFKTVDGDEFDNVFNLVGGKVTLEVYVVAAVDTEPSADRFNHDVTRYIDPKTGKIFILKDGVKDEATIDNTLVTTLVVPGFDLALSASDDSEPITKVGTASAEEVKAIKAAAKVNKDIEFKVADASSGASIVLNNEAIEALGDAPVKLSVTPAVAPAGVVAAYEITLGDNHFGNDGAAVELSIPYDGDATGTVAVAYIVDGKVTEIYDAEIIDGNVVFTTTHLSTYGIITGDCGAVAEITSNGITTKFANLNAAFAAAKSGDELILLADVVADVDNNIKDVQMYLGSFTFNGNGKKITFTEESNSLCINYVDDLVIKNVTLVGDTFAAIYDSLCTKLTVTDCVFDGIYGEGAVSIYLTDKGMSVVINVKDLAISDVNVFESSPAYFDGSVMVNGKELLGPAAMIGDKTYNTLNAAFAAAKDNDEIILLKDIVASANNNVKNITYYDMGVNNLTVNGNGNKIILSDDGSNDMMCILYVNNVLIKDVEFAGKGVAGYYNDLCQNVAIQDCKFTGEFSEGAVDFYFTNNGMKFTVDNCGLKASDVNIFQNCPGYSTSSVKLDGVELTNVAKIGNVEYKTLKDAFAAVKSGDELILLQDVVAGSDNIVRDVALNVEKFTFNGNGNSLVLSETHPYNMLCINYVNNLVIKDVVFEGKAWAGVYNSLCPKLVIENCTFNGTYEEGAVDLYMTNADFEVTITGGNVDKNMINNFPTAPGYSAEKVTLN